MTKSQPRLRRSLGGALLTGLALLASGCAASDAASGESSGADVTTVSIGPTNSYQSLSVAQTTGLLEDVLAERDAQVEWKGPFPAFAPALEAANAGDIEVGTGGLTNYITAITSGTPVVVIGIEDISASVGIVATKESAVTEVADLRGKKVAVNKGGTGEYLLLRALEQSEIAPSEVEFVYLAPEDAASAFNSGSVDAWATWDQYFASAQLVPGATVVVTGTDIDNLNWTFQWVTQEFAEAHPELVQTITATLAESSQAAATDPEIIAELYRTNGASEEVIDLILSWPPYTFYPIGDAEIAMLEQHAADLADYGLIDQAPDLNGTYFKFEE
ncbi:aliphatic sulfonate ABC transporter substrate-binding protein [Gulosibacter chungangensis]|uniref:Putative aliphatic sulfonates-binding protein n=1 Tax=Gulosibacter chungangensis TaxID=979746 RepID=A0A7J5BCL5_9MICO|nr:aliphatic sulfonate ABC transporter substrate-binding protein [Gulosibacter chungangensis]KAB1643921.1 aliphatic sulfonate ABC transporter substrate-binding protein [Gulosibacter chungangensis]